MNPESQPQKVAHLRNLYRRTGFDHTAGEVKVGFGFIHDGSVDTVESFLDPAAFNLWNSSPLCTRFIRFPNIEVNAHTHVPRPI